MSSHVNKIKFYIAVLAALVIGVLFVAIGSVSSSQYLSGSYLKNRLSYVMYKIEYAGGSRFLSAEIGSFDTKPAFYRNDGQSAPSIPILVYHGLTKKDDGSDGINITTKKFRDQMFMLKRAGYETITTDEILRYMKGEITLPQRSFMLTFDDGRRDSYENADPILQALGYEAVMFTIGNYSIDHDTHYYLDSDDLRHMESSGRWDIQAHTYDGHGMIPTDGSGGTGNFFSNKMWLGDENRLETDEEFAERIGRDMVLAKSKLENLLDKEVTAFAFPFGDYGQNASNFSRAKETILAQAAPLYEALMYQQAPGELFNANYHNELSQTRSAFLLRRMDYNRLWPDGGPTIAAIVGNASEKTLPYSDYFSEDRGWIHAWGNVAIADGSLTISGTSQKQGSATVLDGTGHWKDYSVTAKVNSPTRTGVFLWIRFENEANNASCNFGDGFAHIEQTVGGVKRVIKGVREPYIRIPSGDFKITARVVDRNVECSLDGIITVRTEFLDRSLNQGGIGWKTWDSENAQSTLIIKQIEVTDISEKPGGSMPVAASNESDQ